MSTTNADWPEIPFESWSQTCATLHLWTQVVGKIRLARTPWLNHGWHTPLYVTARGLSTSAIPHGARVFEIEFDLRDHCLTIDVSDGGAKRLPLRPQTVAAFHAHVMSALDELSVPVSINDHPCEIAGAIPFSLDEEHASYDAERVQRFWRALIQIDRVFKLFRTGFVGKASPVHFFWGSFDLAVTRFSGRRAPAYEGKVPGVAPAIMKEAYSHEVSSAGFWPGGGGIDHPCFYSYAYPEPEGFRSARVLPDAAYFSEQMKEFLLPYDAVRASADPEATLLAFLQTTYEAAARSARWDADALECPRGTPGRPTPGPERATP